jgi:hypothetical protein
MKVTSQTRIVIFGDIKKSKDRLVINVCSKMEPGILEFLLILFSFLAQGKTTFRRNSTSLNFDLWNEQVVGSDYNFGSTFRM